MASINYKCGDCGDKFNLQYLFIKPTRVKCPSCGSANVKEEASESNSCGCGTRGDNPGRFT
jgi:DNA-directed RNA polymerase subunit RPC12/RpoP